MCYFVTLGVPAAGAAAAVHALREAKPGLSVRPCQNPSVSASFPKSDQIFEITHGGCSCDLFLAAASPAGDEPRQREQYRRKGWSETKIERALAGRRLAHRGRQTAAAVEFRETVVKLAGVAGGLRLLSHMYSGNVDTEMVSHIGRQSLLVHDFVANGGVFPEDVIVDISAG